MSSYIKGNEIVIKTAEQLMAFARDCRLAALKEVREMVAQRRDLHASAGIRPEASYESCVIFELIDALIKREEEGR